MPLHDEERLFELLLLEGAQAGLSWITVLKKRAHYQLVFDNFDAQKIAGYNEKKVTALMNDPGIIRNKLKINAFINNSKAYIKMRDQGTTFNDYFWGFVDGQPIINHFASHSQVPANTPLSDSISKDLKKRGFNFTGSTIIYAYMQSIGMVNDHTTDCFRHSQLK